MRTAAILTMMLVTAPLASEAGLYKWVDDKGRIHYSDTRPDSQSATQGTSELNKRAIIVREAQSAKQREAKLEEEKRARQAELLRLEQRRRDKALLDTFSTTAEIDKVRDRSLEQIDAAINTNGARLKAAIKRLENLQKQKLRYTSRKIPIPADLLTEFANNEKEIILIEKETANRRGEKTDLILRAEEDKKRLLELRSQ